MSDISRLCKHGKFIHFGFFYLEQKNVGQYLVEFEVIATRETKISYSTLDIISNLINLTFITRSKFYRN